MLEKLLEWDRNTLIYLNNLSGASFDEFWTVVTSITAWIPLFLFIMFLLVRFSNLKTGIFKVLAIALMVAVVLLMTNMTKATVARLRPNNDMTVNTLIRVLKHPVDYSFFSGHAATSFSITILVFLFLGKRTRWAGLFFLWPLLFASSRIFVGVHFPMDVLVGAIVGVIMGLISYKVYQLIAQKGDYSKI